MRQGQGISPSLLERKLWLIGEQQAHGGPDGAGVWLDSTKPIGLVHRRLAIIDLSPRGAQPMSRGQLTVTYNGEIYNYIQIKQKLQSQGYPFTTDTDTEVLLWGWHAWGLELLPQLRGMWAFALWDGEALWLVRDRFGVKPLFYHIAPQEIVFASELGALLPLLPSSPESTPAHLHHYLAYGYLPEPHTFYKDIQQVPPGHALRITCTAIEPFRYWAPEKLFFTAPQPVPIEEAESTLLESFQRRLVADVPVGIFLSGGIDSTLLATLLRQKLDIPLPAFTLGFQEKAYDETPHAAQVAQYLGLPHHVLYLSAEDLLPLIEKLPSLYGQPFGDASALAVYALARFTREKVKVVLSADGGDELFAGYVRQTQPIARLRFWAKFLRLLPLSGTHLSKLYPRQAFHNLPTKLLKLKYFRGEHYGELIQAFPEKLAASLVEDFSTSPFSAFYGAGTDWEPVKSRQYIDLTQYLPADVLQKVDRATMAWALEAREPFLDPELVALAGRLPKAQRTRQGQGKILLRQILRRYLPPTLWQRPKQGFAPPLATWLRGPLAEKLRYFLYSEGSPLRSLPLNLKNIRLYHALLEKEQDEWAIFLWHVFVLGLWAEWFSTISPASDNPPLARSAPALDRHTF
jgi:asparagine synthase (glutamine-hydrolysing)